MSKYIQINVPQMGESITSATVAGWRIQEGQSFASGAILVDLETDKVTMEVPAPSSGTLKKIAKPTGTNVVIGELLAEIEVGEVKQSLTENKVEPKQESKVVASASQSEVPLSHSKGTPPPLPSAQVMLANKGIDASQVTGSGKRGQVLKSDVINYTNQNSNLSHKTTISSNTSHVNREEIVPMSRLRQRIAERLVQAKQTAAILTTFNEVDMTNAMELRKKYKDAFIEKYGAPLGFMSIFIKASIHALKFVPSVNAEIRGTDIVYKNYYDISVAVGGPKGLVVPVLRNVDGMNFADIEKELARLAEKVKLSTIELQDLEGGTFTISNGGIFGSMLSTPILNPPQVGILGMHNIVKRPVVLNDEIVIRPIMYIALSYDHRLIDGKEAVTFLLKVKEAVEDPQRILLGI